MLTNITANPFCLLDGEDSDLLLIKHQAVEIIEEEMKACGLTQSALASLCGLHQPYVSEMLSRKLDRFGIERLNKVLAVFNRRITKHYAIEATADAA